MKKIIKDEKGMNTVEVIIILAILVSIALIFRASVFGFVKKSVNNIFNDDQVINMESNIIPTINDNL